MRLKYLHWTKSSGIGGKIEKPEDFIVREIIDKKFLQRFSRGGKKITEQSGYFLYKLRKENTTTKQAIGKIAKSLGIKESDIGYAGLKDKFAVTEQYVTMKKDAGDLKISSISLEKIKPTNKFLSIGDLNGNEFVVMLHDTRFNSKIFDEIKSRPMPNYFGLQRFGMNRNNHVIGKYIIARNFDKALKTISNNSRRKYDKIYDVPKNELKFYIHSYQSWIFNEVLSEIIKKKKTANEIKIVGCNAKLGKSFADNIISAILKKERITPEDFSLRDLGISCIGSLRKAFISVTDIEYRRSGDTLTMNFKLPKGSYATVLINEISK